MNALFLALETRSHQVGIQDGYKKTLGVCIDGHPIEFGLEEKFQRIERSRDKTNPQDSWRYHRYEYISTGTLILKINECGMMLVSYAPHMLYNIMLYMMIIKLI
ncbi:MAG: hypothetical protein K2X00_01120 [Nitrospiraceae bacterium]|nr:hypothetical protein [Nitrospiraceae bacterium]